MREAAERDLPVGTLVAEALGDRDRAAQAQVDARRAREQRAVVGVVGTPRDLAGLALLVEREVDRGFDRRPELPEVRGVAGREVMVPCAGRDVARDVRVQRGVFDGVTEVVRMPAAVGALHAREPVVRRAASSWRPPTSRAIAASTRFHGSVCAPGVHGMLPSASWIDAIASTVAASSPTVMIPATAGSSVMRVISPCTPRGSCRAPG